MFLVTSPVAFDVVSGTLVLGSSEDKLVFESSEDALASGSAFLGGGGNGLSTALESIAKLGPDTHRNEQGYELDVLQSSGSITLH